MVVDVYPITVYKLVDELGSVFPTSVQMYQSDLLRSKAAEGNGGKEWLLCAPMWLRGKEVTRICQDANMERAIQPDIFTDPTLPLPQRWEILKNTRVHRNNLCGPLPIFDTDI